MRQAAAQCPLLGVELPVGELVITHARDPKRPVRFRSEGPLISQGPEMTYPSAITRDGTLCNRCRKV